MWTSIVALCAGAGVAIGGMATPLGAQRVEPAVSWQVPVTSTSPTAIRSAAEPNSRSAFALEAAGGMAGSLIGMGIVAALPDCGVEDLACILKRVGLGGTLGAIGATMGTTLVARRTGSRHSAGGAGIGALVGTGVGLGVHWALNHNSDRNLGDAVVVPIFVISQGLLSAVGSRSIRF